MNKELEKDTFDYGAAYHTKRDVRIIKKDGSKYFGPYSDAGAVKIPVLFRLYAKLMGYDSQFKYGLYNFNTESGYEGLAQMLINDGAKPLRLPSPKAQVLTISPRMLMAKMLLFPESQLF